MIQIDMEMPDSCRECWFLKYDMYAGETSCAIEDMTLAQYFKALDFEGRHEECPLIDVPDNNVGKIVNEQPEIIRCKDCRYSEYDSIFHSRYCHNKGKAELVGDNFFCAAGRYQTNGFD